jgi:hypothetical protein
VLWDAVGPVRHNVTGEWRRLHAHNEEQYDLYYSHYSDVQIKKNENGSACGTMGESIGAHSVLVWRPVGKRLTFNPFQSNFSDNRILPSSYLFWAGKRLVAYL